MEPPWIRVVFSQLEKGIFDKLLLDTSPAKSNMTYEKQKTMRDLAEDRSVVIKQLDTSSCVVAWGKEDYIKEAEKQLQHNSVHQDVNSKEAILSYLVEKSSKVFKSLQLEVYN